jgi:hypothetical protein
MSVPPTTAQVLNRRLLEGIRPICHDVGHRNGAEAGGCLTCAPDCAGECHAQVLGCTQAGSVGLIRTALNDCTAIEAGRLWGNEVREDIQASGRFTEHCHLLGIATEPADVVPHPSERQLLILEPIIRERVTFRVDRWMGEEAEDSESVIERDRNHVTG